MTTQFTNPIHLYRSLLRETTYLFDPFVRSYLHGYIKKSFRREATKLLLTKQASPPLHNGHLPGLDERYQLKRGRQFLSSLQRANEGYKIPLANVIKLAYGRKGRKRRELMADIMKQYTIPGSQDSNISIAESDQAELLPIVASRDQKWAPTPRFEALLQSQIRMQPVLETTLRLKLKPDIPLLNKKGRPMPKCRVKNMTADWYAASAAALFPYLKEVEHKILQDRVNGKGFILKKRRPIAAVLVFSKEETTVDGNAAHLLRGAVKPRSRSQRMVMGKPHKLSVRYLTRMYEREVWRNTPRAIFSDPGIILNFHWDDGQKRLPSSTTLSSGSQSDLLFGAT